MPSPLETLEFLRTSQLLDELRDAWEQEHPKRAEGGLLAISGFEHQFLLTILKIVELWKRSTEAERQDPTTAQRTLTEAVSDITESGECIIITQVKRTLSSSGLGKALEELWDIFKLASTRTPELAEYIQFVISGRYQEEEKDPGQIISGWGTRSSQYPEQQLLIFKSRVRYEIVHDPKEDLINELQNLARDEDSETTISRWLGYYLQIGSGISSESISSLIWRELIQDQGLDALRATLQRLFSLSRRHLLTIRETLGEQIVLPRLKLLELQQSALQNKITLLLGASGSGKSVLCKISVNQKLRQDFDCLFLHPSDVSSFTESPDSTANRGLRRLDEVLMAEIMQKPTLVIIDDLSDANDRDLNAVLNLLKLTFCKSASSNVRFIITAHIESKDRINNKISECLGQNSVCAEVELPQLPIEELLSCEGLPRSICRLVGRHREFGPALNLKLIDYLVRGVQKDEKLDTSGFKNDLDLLKWYWNDYIQNGQQASNLGQDLIKISRKLATEFVPYLPRDSDLSIQSRDLQTLIRRDCLRIRDEKLSVTHRFVGDCSRFYDLMSRQEIEVEYLVECSKNPFWVQPIRWFFLQLALDSEEHETWYEFLCQSLDGNNLYLLDLLLDGAILSKKSVSLLQECPHEKLPIVIERLIIRLLAIATDPYPFLVETIRSKPLQTRIEWKEKITGMPKVELWIPVWHWILAQAPEDIIEKSCVIFRAAEAWLNWNKYAIDFPLRSEVSTLTLGLVEKVLFSIPNSESPWQKNYWLGEFESNAFSCVVFSLGITPQPSIIILKMLAGREIIPTNKPEETESSFVNSFGIGVLKTVHQLGPLAKVNDDFRKFMLKHNGLYLNLVILINPDIGAELFLALIIQEPYYVYEREPNYILDNLNTKGSDDIDICTFKFLPLISLLQMDEETAIIIVEIICALATRRSCEIDDYFDQQNSSSLDLSLEKGDFDNGSNRDVHELSLIIGNEKKIVLGSCNHLYWHRNGGVAPKIITCLLMTIEGWLYSRPSRVQLEHSISLIFKRSSSVAMLGVLVTLAKCDRSLLTGPLMPLTSSLQLLVWLEFETQDYLQFFGFDYIDTHRTQDWERQELIDFHQLPYRTFDLQEKILFLWLDNTFPTEIKSRFLKDWDDYQLALIPENNRHRALRVRSYFEDTNWISQIEFNRNKEYSFIGDLPEDKQANVYLESSFWNLNHIEVITSCREIIDGKINKELDLHNHLVEFLTDRDEINLMHDKLKSEHFDNIIWAAITIILEPPITQLPQDLEADLVYLADNCTNLPVTICSTDRSHAWELDSRAFISHVAPRLFSRIQSESSMKIAIFRCLIGLKDSDTSAFVRSWIKDRGLQSGMTQQIIDIIPKIARLIELTCGLKYTNSIVQRNVTEDESNSCLEHNEINFDIENEENDQFERAWIGLQNQFVSGFVNSESLHLTTQWIPEELLQNYMETPERLRKHSFNSYFNWSFLTAALIPVLDLVTEESIVSKERLQSELIILIINERKGNFIKYQSVSRHNRNSNGNLIDQVHKSQSKILESVILRDDSTAVNQIISCLNFNRFIDCVLLSKVIFILRHSLADDSVTLSNRDHLREQSAFAIGEYIFKYTNCLDSNLEILGKICDVWDHLIQLISHGLESSENVVISDRSLEFFTRFQNSLFPINSLRTQLFRIAQFSGYKELRRTLFTALIQDQSNLPKYQNNESKLLVKLLAELWESDSTWIMYKNTRRQGLREILGKLQELDAVGARNLADQVANSPGGSPSEG